MKGNFIHKHDMWSHRLNINDMYSENNKASLGLAEPNQMLRDGLLVFEIEQMEKTVCTNHVYARV